MVGTWRVLFGTSRLRFGVPAEVEAVMITLRILLIEDDAVIALLLAETLESLGHEVCGIEATEDEAVAAARRFTPDLMIVDAWLGEGSGISAVDEIQLSQPVPHIFVSGQAARVQALRPLSLVLQKPFRESDLVRAIECATDVEPAGSPSSP